MARKKEEPKPVYPTLHEYEDAIHNALQQAGMLMTAVEVALDHPDKFDKLVDSIRERVEALRKALYGSE